MIPRGIARFEFAVVVVIIGILGTLLLDRLTELEREAERLAVTLTIRNIQVGLRLAVAEKQMRGDEAGMAELLDRNPAEFLGSAMGDGWRFDTAARQLVYRPRQPEAFGGQEEVAWRFTGHRDERGGAVGLRLEPVASPGK